MPKRLLALMLALGLPGCAMVRRHAYFEPIPKEYPASDSPEVRPITYSEFFLSGIIIPFFPFYSRASPLMVSLRFPSDPVSCPPAHVRRGMERDTVHATSIAYRSCHYELENGAPDFLEVVWAGRALRTGFHREVDWSYHPFFFPTH